MINVNYQDVMDTIVELMQVAVPIGFCIGLCERLISLVLDAGLDRIRRRERL